METRKRMAAFVVERNILRNRDWSQQAADAILAGHMIYEADTDTFTITTTGRLQTTPKGTA